MHRSLLVCQISIPQYSFYSLPSFSLTTTIPPLGSSASKYSPTLTLNVSPSTTDMSLDSLGPFPNHHLTHLQSDTCHRDMLVQSDSLIGEHTILSQYVKSLSCKIFTYYSLLSVLPTHCSFLALRAPSTMMHQQQYTCWMTTPSWQLMLQLVNLEVLWRRKCTHLDLSRSLQQN